jgi:hypothetical protein
MNSINRETSRHFRNTKKLYLKSRINELALNSKNTKISETYKATTVFNYGY